MNPATEPKTTEAGAWITLPASADGVTHKVLPAWHVDEGATKICVIIAPIWVTQINRLEGFVTWRVPNQPLDVERTAPFASIHSKIESALAHAARLLPALDASGGGREAKSWVALPAEVKGHVRQQLAEEAKAHA